MHLNQRGKAMKQKNTSRKKTLQVGKHRAFGTLYVLRLSKDPSLNILNGIEGTQHIHYQSKVVNHS